MLNPFVDSADLPATMHRFANHALLVKAGIIGDLITAVGIIVLAVLLHALVAERRKPMAHVALGLYILEASLLAVSKIAVFVLLKISQEYTANGDQSLEAMARLALEAERFIYKMHIVPFGLGAILFYFLLHRSNAVPRWLSLWGLTTVPFVLCGAVWSAIGTVPVVLLALAVLYVPFEFVAGIFILVKGIPSITRRKD